MHPILFQLGDFPVTTFGLMVCLGAIAASLWLKRHVGHLALGGDDPAADIVTALVLWGLLGARLLYVAIHPEALRDAEGAFNPLLVFALWQGGLVSYGGFVGGTFGAWRFARKRKIPFRRLGDVLAPPLFLGQAIGRIGCLLVGDDHGRPTDLPWAIRFPDVPGSLIPRDLIGVPLHPSQIYLSAMNFALFAILASTFARRRFDGQVMCLGITLYAIGRFAIEFTRGDDRARGIYGPFSTSQWASLAAFVVALAVWAHARRTAPARA